MNVREHPSSNNMLAGRGLVVARLAWIILVASQVAIVAYGYPLYIQRLLSLDVTSTTLSGSWTTQTLSSALSSLRLSPNFLAGLLVFLDTLQVFSYLIVGGLIFWRKSNTWLGLFASYVLFGIGLTIGGGSETLQQIASPWQELVTFATSTIWPFFFIFLFLFPDGQFAPRWMRLFIPLWGLFYAWFGLSDLILKLGFDTFRTIGLPFIIVTVCASLFSQIYRYLRVSGPIERQQTKWFLLAITLLLFWAIFSNLVFDPFLRTAGLSAGETLLLNLAWQPISVLAMASLPLSVAIALFRYRLWDIDFIIRRTLVYGALTLTLAVVYFGSVVIILGLLGTLVGNSSQAAIVASTLAIAALFTPLRRRIQNDIDRRFYRRRYNAEQALQAFAVALRGEVDLDQLNNHIFTVIRDTMQPESISLWMINPVKPEKSEAAG